MDEKVKKFLERHGMLPEHIDPAVEAVKMVEDMKAGLAGEKADMMMIPAYVSTDGELPVGGKAIVIDAGGTNFRNALAEYNGEWCEIRDKTAQKMPGIAAPTTWDEFVAFTADAIERFSGKTDLLGYCFSYSAEITPEIDGRVKEIDKEVTIRGCEGKLVGESLKAELAKRGMNIRKVTVINDTVACLLGGMASADKSRYSGFTGQISGTGTNTCCVLPANRIPKLHTASEKKMVVNLESGCYSGMPRGDFDEETDRASNAPGEKLFEKMTAGVYLGELDKLMLEQAAKEGCISRKAGEYVEVLGKFDAAQVDAWSLGKFGTVDITDDDKCFITGVSLALLDRSARCMCTNLIAMALLTGDGTNPAYPICDCAEGSLVQKCVKYREALESYLKEYGAEKSRVFIELNICEGTTLPGAAAAALLN